MLISCILSKLKNFFQLISTRCQHFDRFRHLIKFGVQHYNITIEVTYSGCVFLFLSLQLHILSFKLLNQLFLFLILLTHFTTFHTQLPVGLSKLFKCYFLITGIHIRIVHSNESSDKFGTFFLRFTSLITIRPSNSHSFLLFLKKGGTFSSNMSISFTFMTLDSSALTSFFF